MYRQLATKSGRGVASRRLQRLGGPRSDIQSTWQISHCININLARHNALFVWRVGFPVRASSLLAVGSMLERDTGLRRARSNGYPREPVNRADFTLRARPDLPVGQPASTTASTWPSEPIPYQSYGSNLPLPSVGRQQQPRGCSPRPAAGWVRADATPP